MNAEASQIIPTAGRLLFRPHRLTDLEDFVAMEQDAEVRRYVGGQPRTREAAEQRFMNGLKQPVTERLRMWATVLKQDGIYIGRCGVFPHFNQNSQPIPGEGALGLYIARAYWRQGYATEAGRALLHFGFEALSLNRIVTTIEFGNDASVHVIKKLGFLLESTEQGTRSFYHFAVENQMSYPPILEP